MTRSAFLATEAGGSSAKKWIAGGDHVGGQHQIVARPLAIERRVVGQAEGAGIGRQRPEIALDQLELAGALFPLRRHRG